MTSPELAPRLRLAGLQATSRSTHLAGALTVVSIAASAALGIWHAPLIFFAVGAGAGYSLSGSV